jgi:fatty-acyl-CoA synthase
MSMAGLLDWLDEPRDDAGLRVVVDDEWRFHSYAALAAAVGRQAAALADRGVGVGDVVGASTGAPLDFLATFHGALVLGAVPLPLVPPGLLGDGFAEHLAGLVRVGRPKVVVVGEPDHQLFADAIAAAGVPAACLRPAAPENGGPLPPRATPGDLALLQFTSGSSGRPRAVRIGWDNLEANIRALARSWAYGPGDAIGSWLPLHHDMGLTGCFLLPVVHRTDLWLLTPEQFLFQPLRWIECFGRYGANVTCSPNLGYGFSARRLGAEHLTGMDFSGWRVAVIAAERVDPATMDAFVRFAGDFGFRPEMFRPSYGLAEATLAVSVGTLERAARIVSVDWDSLSVGAQVAVTGETLVGEAPGEAGFDALVSAGVPLDGVPVRIVDEGGRELPEGHLGEVVVGGPGIARGYLGGDEPDEGDDAPSAFRDGELHTGDAGFLDGGELFLVGRMVDSVSVLGRQVYVEGLEALVAGVLDVPASRCVVVPSAGVGGRAVALVVEAVDDRDLVAQAADKLRWQLGFRAPVLAYAVPRGTLRRTTSGKVRRRHMWAMLLRGDLDVHAVGGEEQG